MSAATVLPGHFPCGGEKRLLTSWTRRSKHKECAGMDDASKARDLFVEELEELRRRNANLEKSEARLRAVLENDIQAFILVDRDYRIKLLNRVACELAWQVSCSEIEQEGSLLLIVPEAYREKFKEHIDRALGGELVHLEEKVDGEKGEIFWFEFFIAPVLDQKGVVSDAVLSILDITGRKINEEQIRASLNEKEVLLREVHHRVKNNMQIISSLLNLQAKYISDPDVARIFMESQKRVRSMALIHEKLYHSKDLSSVNFSEYLRSLVSYLCHNSGRDSIFCSIKAGKVMMGVDIAIPLGLIVNELVSNALKHAFPGENQGTVHIELKPVKESKGLFTLSISDDGVGLGEDVKFDESRTLGLQLVKDMVEQIDGTLELKREKGTSFLITLPARAGV
jgi:PAS domain S-box-containing protein